ncbi:MAG: (Fe-S)-binding protein, partial [Bacteroidales bacterium]|nr:(Fe-S)-binding protein [Bacteroidales bacterium]
RLLAESVTASLRHNGGWLTQTLGDALSGLPAETLQLPLWWLYSIVLCIFFLCLPFTRYMHIFAEMLLIFLRKWGVVEEKSRTGYTDVETNACSRCGICIDVCPLNTAAGIHNVQSVYFIRDIRQHGLTEDVANNCLLCDRCVEACPVGIETTQIRQILRGEQKTPQPDKTFYDYLPQQASTVENGCDTVYFAGCMTHLSGGIIPAMRKLFEAAGDRYIFLDEERNLCCGRPLRQQGYTRQADQMRDKLERIINQSGAKRLVTSCPICYHSFRQEYHLDMPVLHHSEYLRECLENKKISLNNNGIRYAYHDPCELGRGEKVYEAPREILKAAGTLCVTGADKSDAPCCGYSLGDTAIDTRQRNLIRDEALEVLCTGNPDMLATACPLCKKAFMTGNSRIPVKDIAEIAAGEKNGRGGFPHLDFRFRLLWFLRFREMLHAGFILAHNVPRFCKRGIAALIFDEMQSVFAPDLRGQRQDDVLFFMGRDVQPVLIHLAAEAHLSVLADLVGKGDGVPEVGEIQGIPQGDPIFIRRRDPG